MASKKPVNHKNSTTLKQQPKTKTTAVKQNLELIDKLDQYLSKKISIIFWICLILLIICSALIFDLNVGMGGDDSAYIMRAYDFIHHFTYPGYQGPLYPSVLSIFMYFFGINLFLLKFLSLIFLVIGFTFFYKAFRSRIPAHILTIALLLLCINYFFLYFSSQTYSETFFMMLQFMLFWYFGKHFLDSAPENRRKIKEYILLGLILFLMTITRNLAIACIGVVLLFFFTYRRWKDALFTFLSYIGFYGLFEILKRILWGNNSLQFASQGNGLLNKDFYNPSLGKEDAIGFVHRFLENSNLYFSKHIFKFFGLLDESAVTTSTFLTIIIYAIIIGILIFTIRKNKILFLSSLYVLIMSMVTFLALQKTWDQWRLVVIYYPFIILMLFASIYFIFRKKMKVLHIILMPLLTLIIFLNSFGVLHKHTAAQSEILSQNLSGNSLYGWTPDWQNYILLSKWAGKNLPENAVIGCRKPEISFIYGQRKFYQISKVPAISTDSLISTITEPNHYVAVRINQVTKPDRVQITDPILRTQLYALVNGKFAFNNELSENFGVVAIFKMTDEQFNQWKSRPEFSNSLTDKELSAWLKKIGKSGSEYAIYLPDMLLNNLKKDNVRFLIAANLRANPNVCDGNIISTVQRYIYFIQMKYPEIFSSAGVFGNEESATLVQINY